MSEIYMMVTICNRKQMQKFVKFYKQNHVDTGNISLAMGTAASDVLDYFGLEEDEKGIHFCLVTRPDSGFFHDGFHNRIFLFRFRNNKYNFFFGN